MAGVTFDITARIKGYEESLARLRKALDALDPGSNLARSIRKGIESVEGQVKALGRNLNPQISNDNQLDRLTDKINATGNAINHLGEQMQNVASTDLNINAIKGFSELNKKLIELKAQLSAGIQDKFIELINNSTELNDAFKSLDLDISGKNSDQILEELNAKLKEASVNVDNYEKEYSKAVAAMAASEKTVEAIKLSPFADADSKNELTKELHNITDSYTEAFKELREKVAKNLQDSYGDKVDVKSILDSFFSGLDSNTIKEHLENMMGALNIKKGEKRDFYKQIFGANEAAARDINTLITSLGLPSAKEVQEALRDWVEKISQGGKYGASGSQEQELLNLINKGDVEKFTQEAEKDVVSIWKRVQDVSKREGEKANQAATTLHVIDKEKSEEQAKHDLIQQTINTTTSVVETASSSEGIRQLQQDIADVNQQMNECKQNTVDLVSEAGKGAQEAAQQYHIAATEVNQYSDELEKAKQREQLVGKIEGVVQRWFSIYAAVRMVSRAIKSMISTIKELDKTITDIAIVTNMNQNDLWGQMPEYTAMAREYAVSISGVYKVSQLFYQQGLQTNDVMRLSAETLKLARIAGIDYADAANYMTNAIRSFKLEMEDASKVTDAYSALAAASATSVSELAEAMSKTASSAYSVGSSLENTAAMIAVMTEATRESASNIGSALKSIISRYGEMKASPKDILNIDGEEASFNKVDTALKSIGISLKDARGQFRDFDDVIMELASVWDTLDNNTQRYIATIMAGNRQQSRFIALVSSYDRLKELTGIAAESEDAAQQQFLKTLDSIEAKTQQLQTSLQNLYTSAGLEQLYKGLLDQGANVLNYYNNIANTFGSGITGALAAVATFGSQFYNLANIVLKVLRLVKTHYINNQKQLDLLASAHAKIRAHKEIDQEERMALKSKGIYTDLQKSKTRIYAEEEQKRAKITQRIQSKIEEQQGRQKTGDVLYGIGTVGSIVGTSIGGTYGTGLSAFGSVISGVGAFMTHNWIGFIMSIISTITNLINLFPSLSTQIEQANQKLTELRNTESQTKSEEKNLTSAIKQEEELRKARYKSVEDAEAYQDALNNLAELAPSLIIGYTEAGDVILDVTRAEEVLAQARAKTRKATYEAALQELNTREIEAKKVPQEAKTALNNLRKQTSRITTESYISGEYSPVTETLLRNFSLKESNVYDLSDTTIDLLSSYKQSISSLETMTEADKQILDWINELLKAYPEVLENRQTINNARQTLSSAYLLSEKSSQYEFIEGSSGLETLASKKVSEISQKYSSWETFTKRFSDEWLIYFNKFYKVLTDEQITLFDKMMANPQLYSVEDFTNAFGKITGITDLLTQYFTDYTANGFDRLKSGLKSIKATQAAANYLASVKKQGYEFTNTEADFLLDAYQNAITLFDSSLKDQSKEYFKAFFSDNITEILQSLNADEKEIFYSLWSQYGINTKAGIQSIIDELINNYNFDEDNLIITSLRSAQKALVENVALTIQSAADKFSENWDKDSENIVKLTQGIEFTDVTKTIAAADKIGLELNYNDFVQNGDKFVLSAEKYNEYVQKYFETQQKGTEDWVNTVEKLNELVTDGQLNDNIDYQKLIENSVFMKEIGFDKTIEGYLSKEEGHVGELTEQGLSTLQQLIQSAADNLNLYNWLIQQANNNLAKQYIEAGNIRKALKLLMPDATTQNIEDEINNLASGNYAEVSELIQPYLSLFVDYFNNINKSVVDAFINSLNKKGAQTIDVNDDNRKFLEYWKTNGQQYITFSANGTKATIDFANATVEHLNDIRQQIINGELKLSEENKESAIAAIDKELYTTRSPVEATKQILENYSGFSREVAESFANAINENLDDLVGEYALFQFDKVTGKYTTNLKQFFENLYENSDVTDNSEAMAEISDAVQDFFSSVADKIEDGLKGSLSAGGARELSDIARQFNIELDFSQTVDGLRMSNEAAIELWATLTEVDKIAAELVFKSLKDQLTKAGESCENIFKTLSKIEATTKSLNSDNVKNTNELKNQLALYKQIAKEQMFDEKSYDFMNFALPDGFESPLTYWENVQKMQTTLKDAVKNEYITQKDYYNSIQAAFQLAQLTGKTYKVVGVEISKDQQAFSDAWRRGVDAWATLEDGTNVVDLTRLGVDFKADVDGMSDNFDDGFKAFAAEQVKMLDTIIPFFETIVALQDTSDTLGTFKLDEIFDLELGQIDSGKAQEVINFFNQLDDAKKTALQNIKIKDSNGVVSIFDYLSDFKNWEKDIQGTYDLLKGLQNLVNVKDWQSGADLFKYADFGEMQTKLILVDDKGNEIQAFSDIVPHDEKDNVIEYQITISTKQGDMEIPLSDLGALSNFIDKLDIGDKITGSIPISDSASIDYSIEIDDTNAAHVKFGDAERKWENGTWDAATISDWINQQATSYQSNKGTGAITVPALAKPSDIKLDDGRIIKFTSTLTDESGSGNIKYALPTGATTEDISLAESSWQSWVDQHHIDDGFAGFEVVTTTDENGNSVTYIKLQKDDGAELYYKLNADGEATQLYKTPLGEYTTKESAAKSWALYAEQNDLATWAKEQGFTQVGLRLQNDGTIDKVPYVGGQEAQFDYIFKVDTDEDVTYNDAELGEGETIETKVTNWRDNLPTSDTVLALIKEKYPNADFAVNTEEDENGGQKPKSITFGDGVEIDWTFPLSDKAGTSAEALDAEVADLLTTVNGILAKYNAAKARVKNGFSSINLPGTISISVTDAGKYVVTGTGLVDENNQPVGSLTFDSLDLVQGWLTSLIPNEDAFHIDIEDKNYKVFDDDNKPQVDARQTLVVDTSTILVDQKGNLLAEASTPAEIAQAMREIEVGRAVAVQKASKQFAVSKETFNALKQGDYGIASNTWEPNIAAHKVAYGENLGKNFISSAFSFLSLVSNDEEFKTWKNRFKNDDEFNNWLSHFYDILPDINTTDFSSQLRETILNYFNDYMLVDLDDHNGYYTSDEATQVLQEQVQTEQDNLAILQEILTTLDSTTGHLTPEEFQYLTELSQVIKDDFADNLDSSLGFWEPQLAKKLNEVFKEVGIDWTDNLKDIDFSKLLEYLQSRSVSDSGTTINNGKEEGVISGGGGTREEAIAAVMRNRVKLTEFSEEVLRLNKSSATYENDIQVLYEGLKEAIGETDWATLSTDIGQGVLQELMNPADNAEAANVFSDDLFKQFMAATQAGSPALKYEPIGEYIAQGIGLGIKNGNLQPAIKALIEKSLGVDLGSVLSGKAINKGSNTNDRRNSVQTLVDETEKGNSNIITAIESIAQYIKLPSLQELRQALDGIATHTDFLINGSEGTGVTANNFVLATEAGNQHYNVQMDNNGVTLVPAERNTAGYHDTIVIPFESDTTELDATVEDLEKKQVGIPVEATNLANFKAQILAYIRAIAGTQIGMNVYVQSVTTDGITSTSTTGSVASGVNKIISKLGSQAKGNAQSKGTLMGELGPELYVTGGHYYVAGQNGAEFVNLPDDAIVFNHLQTKRLMSTGSAGRGSAVTNEKKATSYATGNLAMASASDILQKLKELRDMWSSLASTTPKSLATKGGGGGGGKDEAINLHDLDRWYNLMRQIEKIEEQITYQQKLRENMRNGGDYIKSLEYELALLEKEQANYQLLSELQKSYYEARRRDQEESIYGKIFTYDSDGLMQYVDGAFRDVLAKMEEQRTTGVMKYTNAEQKKILTNYLLAQGVSQKQINDTLNYKTDGTKVENDEEWIENFWDKFDGWIEEMDSMYDSYTEYQTKVQEMIAEQNKILEEYRDLQLDLEQQLLKAIEDREQAVIDKLQDTYDAINDSSQKYIDGLSDALSREQNMYNRNQDKQELTQLQRRLGILQRSGGSGSEILSLQKQIEAQLKENYFSEQQNQIDAIKEASDAQLEKLQQQIDIAQETLEYQKENGLFWAEVTSMMQNWEPSQLADFIQQNSREMFEKSPLDVETTMAQTLMDFEKWYELRNRFGAFNDWYDNEMTNDVLKNTYGVNINNKTELTRARAIAKEAYQRYYAEPEWAQTNGYVSAEEAAKAALLAEKQRKAGTPKDYTQGTGKTNTSGSSGGNNSNSGGGVTVEQVLGWWNDQMAAYEQAKNFATRTPMSFADWYASNNKWGYTWAEIMRGKQGTGDSDWAVAYNEAWTTYNAYKTAFEKEVKDSLVGARKQADDAIAEMKRLLNGYPVALKGKTVPTRTFEYGGMVDKTGFALVHAKEGVLTPDQVDMLRQLTIAEGKQSIIRQFDTIKQQLADMSVPLTAINETTNNPIVIQNATVEMNIDSIANDYDARRAGEQALEEMMRIARKTSVQSLRR